jgi:hypothetical protein
MDATDNVALWARGNTGATANALEGINLGMKRRGLIKSCFDRRFTRDLCLRSRFLRRL